MTSHTPLAYSDRFLVSASSAALSCLACGGGADAHQQGGGRHQHLDGYPDEERGGPLVEIGERTAGVFVQRPGFR